MQGGGGYGGYGNGMQQNGMQNGGYANGYSMGTEENTEQAVRSPMQASYAPEQSQQRAVSPLANVSSGYAPRTSTNMPYSPAGQQQASGMGSGIPPLNLNPQQQRAASPPPSQGAEATGMSGQYNYGAQSPSMPYSPYQQYQPTQQYDQMSNNAYGAGADLKHRNAQSHGNEWSTDYGSYSPQQRKAYSPTQHTKQYNPSAQPGQQKQVYGYDGGYNDYGYAGYGGYQKKNNKFLNFFMTGNLRFLLLLLIPSIFLIFAALRSDGTVSIYPSSGNFEVKIGDKDLDKLGNGISVVGACMNRQEKLPEVLKNWLDLKDAKEIVLVDWSSDPPLKDVVDTFDDPRLKLVRVDDEEKWVLSRAFNVGMQFASYEKVVRVDCDYALSENFVEGHPIEEGKNFFSGDWETARNENEIHLNGAMHVHQKDFWKVMGYDERIQTYGWDDEDMYTRLKNNAKLDRTAVNYDLIFHYPHDDSARAQDGVKFVEVETDYNRIMLEKLPVWGPDMTEKSSYNVEAKGNYYELNASERPRSVAELTDESGRDEAWSLALGRRLHDEYDVPWDFLSTMSSPNKELLLKNLMAKHVEGEEPPRILFGHAMHGLGNRLRALGSMLSYAKNTGKEFVVIWENDEHCGAEFKDLFKDEIVQLAVFNPKAPFTENKKFDEAYEKIAVYNYMELEDGANKGEIISDDPARHTYYKGAYIMEAPGLTDWEQDNENLRLLTPADEVQEIIDQQKNNDFTGMVGVHIRNRDLAADIQNVDFSKEYTAEASNTMDYWRHKSHYKNFIDRMRQLLIDDPDLKFYVASDTFEVQEEMEREFEGKIIVTDRKCDDRDSSCVRFALADLYNLGKTKKMLGSNWSSFTEAAQRLGGIQAELAGQDFAVDPNGPPSG